MIVDVLRHGALEGGEKYRGHTEEALTPEGRFDMQKVWQEICFSVDVIVSSPLSRCAEPAKEWAEEACIPHVIEPNIIEMYYGVWEGKTKQEIEAEFPGMLKQWRENPEGIHIPDAEMVEQLQQRIILFWEKLCSDYADKHVLIIAHSGSSRMLVSHVLAAPIVSTRRMSVPYAAWSRIEHNQGESRLVFLNQLI
ncbi:MAG: histidine phosphatase family protein [Mariprofundaceae bacterium]